MKTVPARQVHTGMRVHIKGSQDEWTVLDRHPDIGYWWLHRWIGSEWQTHYAHYRQLLQIIE